MRILYVTANVLGDSGANAAELFPRYSMLDPTVKKVIVADYAKNRSFIQKRQFAEFLRLRNQGSRFMNLLRAGVRIARKAKAEQIDVIHVFYRLENVPLVILMRLALIMLWAPARIIVDHRSVDLSRGAKSFRKKLGNFFMQVACHALAGNPWAVETNHWWVFRKKHIIDLGYDTLPPNIGKSKINPAERSIWFIGSMKPKNRKSEFLLAVFTEIRKRLGPVTDVRIRVAGPTNSAQYKELRNNPLVTYYGMLPRPKLYELLNEHPGVGVAFMNQEFHFYAPSLKFCEYAIMQYKIVASDTLGLRTQAKRMNMDRIIFSKEDVGEWAEKLIAAAREMNSLEPRWSDAPLWSYTNIYTRQVRLLHQEYSSPR